MKRTKTTARMFWSALIAILMVVLLVPMAAAETIQVYAWDHDIENEGAEKNFSINEEPVYCSLDLMTCWLEANGTGIIGYSSYPAWGNEWRGSIQNVTLNVAGIGSEAFSSMQLQNVQIGSSVTYIGEDAFSGCSYLNVTYGGTEEQWRNLDIRSGNDALLEGYDNNDFNHTWDSGTVISAPKSCNEQGQKRYVCEVCGKERIMTLTIPHTWSDKVTTSANCTEYGKETQICIACGKTNVLTLYSDPPKGHSFGEGVTTKTSTCTQTGITTYTCTVCGKTKEETISKTAHVYETVNKKTATCSEEGYTGDRVCKNCGYVQSSGSVIAKKAHTWNDGVITTPATCAVEGVKTFTCTVCSATKTEPVAKTNSHNYGYEYYDNDGELWERYVCSVCGNIKAENKHVHDYQFSGPVENLSFFHEAEYTRTCRCGHVETCTYQLQVDDSLTKQAYATEIMRYADNCRSLGLHPHAGYYWAAIGAKEIGSGAQYEHFQSLSRSFQLFEIRAVCENFGQGSSEVIGGTAVKEMFKIPLPKDYNAELLTVYKLEGNAETILEYSIEDNYVVIETAYPSGRFYLAIVDPQHVHMHTENRDAVPATCTEHGYTAGVYCNDCGTWISGHDDLGTNRENHNYVNGKCSRCGNTQIIAAKDPVTDVSVTYEYDAFAPGTQIAVKELYSTPTSRAWSISPLLNGQKVQPSKPVQVKLPIPEGWSKKDIILRHTDSFGHTEYPAFTVEGNYVVFMVSSFSEYSIELKTDDSPEQTSDSNTQPSGNACKYCGEEHTGFFGKLIGFFHSILALFGLHK